MFELVSYGGDFPPVWGLVSKCQPTEPFSLNAAGLGDIIHKSRTPELGQFGASLPKQIA
jgi:hypothetical protein